MSKIIEAKAVISAADKTGNVFDKLAANFKGIENSAKESLTRISTNLRPA